jgi:hypothetical protein
VILLVASCIVLLAGTTLYRNNDRGSKPKRPRFKESGPYSVFVGTNSTELEPGIPENLLRDLLEPTTGDTLPVTAVLIDGEIMVSARLGRPGFEEVDIVNNQIALFRSSTWDENSNDTALEIVNEKLEPMLQIIYRTSRTAVINGVFSGGRLVYTATPQAFVGRERSAKPDSTLRLKRLFRYPSRDHRGEIDQPTPPASSSAP